MKRTTWCARVLAVVSLTACYRYAPATEPSIAAGTYVRLSLGDSAGPSLRNVLGIGTTGVEGQVVAATDSAYAMSVAATLKPGPVTGVPSRIVWAGESVLIPRVAIASVERRSLDRGRTTRAIALATVAALVSVKLIVSTVGSSSGGDNGGIIVTPP